MAIRASMGWLTTLALLGGVAGCSSDDSAPAGSGGDVSALADPTQSIHGRTLGEWAEAYWRWKIGGGSAADADRGDAYFIDLPQGADADPSDANAIMTGHLDLTVPAGKPLVLPLAAWTTESYTTASGLPDDLPLHDACFDPALDPRSCVLGTTKGEAVYTWMTLDGRQVAVNQHAFYAGYRQWATPLAYATPSASSADAATGDQTILVVIEPLAAGVHTITNYVDFGPPGVFYDNSWTLTATEQGSAVAVGTVADEAPPPIEAALADPSASIAGRTFQQWFTAYWEWMLTGADATAATASDVVFLGMPNGTDVDPSATVTWNEGQLAVTVPAGKPFILPLMAWITESYTAASGTPDDLPAAAACYDPALDPRGCEAGARLYDANHVYVTLDGQRVAANQSAHYSPYQAFATPIAYSAPTSYGADAATGCQGVAVVVNPLSAGQHTLTLLVDFGSIGHFFYDNTWTITAQ